MFRKFFRGALQNVCPQVPISHVTPLSVCQCPKQFDRSTSSYVRQSISRINFYDVDCGKIAFMSDISKTVRDHIKQLFMWSLFWDTV